MFAGGLRVGVGDEVRVDGELTSPEPGESGFDYGRYLGTVSRLLNSELSPNTPLTSNALSG